MRIAPPRVTPEALPAPKPPAGSPGADAYRQTSFVLGGEVDAILAALNAEGAVAAASAGSRFRTVTMAGALLQWSQGWLCRLHALHAVQHGNYAAAFPLIDRAFEHIAACAALLREPAQWERWVDSGITAAPADHGTRIHLEPATKPASEPGGEARSVAAALAKADFGVAIVLAGGESTPERLAATFGDRDFHLGLAELALGLVAAASLEQLALVTSDESPFAKPDGTSVVASVAALERLVQRPDRCRAELLTARSDGARFLLRQWRRAPGGAPRRLVL
jgi:hypothetical protein